MNRPYFLQQIMRYYQHRIVQWIFGFVCGIVGGYFVLVPIDVAVWYIVGALFFEKLVNFLGEGGGMLIFNLFVVAVALFLQIFLWRHFARRGGNRDFWTGLLFGSLLVWAGGSILLFVGFKIG